MYGLKFSSNLYSVMFFNITFANPLCAHHSFGKHPVQETCSMFHDHRPLCNGTSSNSLICTRFKVLSVMVSR